MRPDHAAVFGRPVAVDVVRCHQVHAELLHRRAGGLGAEGGHAQRAQVVLLHVAHVLRVGHDGLQEGDTGLEDAHPVAFDHRGVAPGMREGRCAFAQHPGAARAHRGAEHVALAGDPAGVGNDVDHVARPRIEGHLHRVGDAGRPAAVHMHHALGLAGGARGVDEEQRELGVQRRRRAAGPDGAHEVGVGQCQQLGFAGIFRQCDAGGARGLQQRGQCGIGQLMAPAVAAGAPDQVGLRGVAHHHHRLDPRRRGHQGLGHRGAHARGLGRVQSALASQLAQRPADAAHPVAALHRHLAGQGVVHRGEQLLPLVLGQAELGQALRDAGARGRDRHVIVECGVGVGGLEGDDLCVAVAAVGGDHDARAGVVDAVRQGLVGEAAEHRGVDHAQPLGGLRPVELRRDVGQVQRDAVTGLQAQGLQGQCTFGGLEQQPLARDRIGLDRCAAAAVARHVPAVALEQEGRLAAVARQHMAVDLVEAGVRQAAFEPLPVRRVVGVEGALPGLEGFTQVEAQRGAGLRVPAGPALACIVEAQPGPVRTRGRQEPMDLALGDRAVEGAGVGDRGGALCLPVAARAQRVGLGLRQAGRAGCGRGGRHGGKLQGGWASARSGRASCERPAAVRALSGWG